MKRRPDSTPSKDDVFALTHGRPSQNRVGRRDIAHRLQKHEHEKLQIAERRGYLLVNKRTRQALKNSWFLLCQAKGAECVLLSQEEGEIVLEHSAKREKIPAR